MQAGPGTTPPARANAPTSAEASRFSCGHRNGRRGFRCSLAAPPTTRRVTAVSKLMSLRWVPLGEGCALAGACTGSLSTVCAHPLSCSWMRVRPRGWRVASCSSGAGASGREVISSSAGNVVSAASRRAGAAAREAPLPSLLAGVRWTSAAQASATCALRQDGSIEGMPAARRHDVPVLPPASPTCAESLNDAI